MRDLRKKLSRHFTSKSPLIISVIIAANGDKETFRLRTDRAVTSAITCAMKQLINEKKGPPQKVALGPKNTVLKIYYVVLARHGFFFQIFRNKETKF